MKEVPWLYFLILLAVTYSFTSCATKPVTVKSDQPIEKKSNEDKFSSEKTKQVPHVIEKPKSIVSEVLDQGSQIENESRESSENGQADLQQKEVDSLNQLKSDDSKRSKDLASTDKEEDISAGLKTGNEKIAEDVGHGNKKMNLSNQTTKQEEDGLESFFSAENSKPTREENGGLKSTNGGSLAGQKNVTEGASSKSKTNINKRGDPSFNLNEKPLSGSSGFISDPVRNEVNRSVVVESDKVAPSSGPNRVVGFANEVKSVVGDDLVENDVAVGFHNSGNSLGDKGELYSPVQQVGFGEKKQKISNTKPITDSARKDEISRQQPRTFGRIRTFLDRREVSGIEEGIIDERGFKRTKDFFDADRGAKAQDLPVLDRNTDMQYGKTLKWIKNRGRID